VLEAFDILFVQIRAIWYGQLAWGLSRKDLIRSQEKHTRWQKAPFKICSGGVR
jgi:hypothetical protein